MTATRLSPVHSLLTALVPTWEERAGMHVVAKAGGDDAARLASVALADLSYLPRYGLKGPGADAWLRSHGVEPPAAANRWLPLEGGGLIARLGRTEFFIEDGRGGSVVETIRSSLRTGAPDVYPVARQDAGLALAGAQVNALLVQTCNVDFESLAVEDRIVVMTQMIGVSVLAIRTNDKPMPTYRLWCDPTFAPYFWETLSEIARELGGGVIGTDGLPG